MRRLIPLALVLVLTSGCAFLANWPSEIEARESLESLLTREDEVKTLWADGWVRLENRGESVVFPAEFVVAYPDRFLMTAFGLFDRTEAYLASDGYAIALYLVSENRFFEGPAKGDALSTVLGLPPMEVSELMGFLAGRVPVASAQGASLKADKWSGRWSARVGPLTAEELLVFPRLGGRVERFFRTAGGHKLDVRFSNFGKPDDGSERRFDVPSGPTTAATPGQAICGTPRDVLSDVERSTVALTNPVSPSGRPTLAPKVVRLPSPS
jgi:hypothetical protein